MMQEQKTVLNLTLNHIRLNVILTRRKEPQGHETELEAIVRLERERQQMPRILAAAGSPMAVNYPFFAPSHQDNKGGSPNSPNGDGPTMPGQPYWFAPWQISPTELAHAHHQQQQHQQQQDMKEQERELKEEQEAAAEADMKEREKLCRNYQRQQERFHAARNPHVQSRRYRGRYAPSETSFYSPRSYGWSPGGVYR